MSGATVGKGRTGFIGRAPSMGDGGEVEGERKCIVALERVGLLSGESELEKVAGLKPRVRGSPASLCEIVSPGDRVAFESH